MSTANIFEVATRKKYRYPYKGMITTEDLWDLPLTALDGIYKTLNKQAKQSQEESLLNTSATNETLENQIAIIKYIVATKQQEQVDRLKEKERAEQKQKIMEILADKQDETLKGKSVEELQKMLEEM